MSMIDEVIHNLEQLKACFERQKSTLDVQRTEAELQGYNDAKAGIREESRWHHKDLLYRYREARVFGLSLMKEASCIETTSSTSTSPK
jgi:hypothetical protein